MYMHAMELVRFGDTSVDAYDKLMSLFKVNMQEMQPFAEVWDGLGLEDQVPDNGVVVDQLHIQTGNDRGIVQAHDAVLADGDVSVSRSINRMAGLSAPAKRRELGRLTTSRGKSGMKD